MKKSTKLLICCVVAAAVIFGGIAYVFRPLTFSQAIGGVKTEEIEKLVIHKDGEQVDILSARAFCVPCCWRRRECP